MICCQYQCAQVYTTAVLSFFLAYEQSSLEFKFTYIKKILVVVTVRHAWRVREKTLKCVQCAILLIFIYSDYCRLGYNIVAILLFT